MKSQVNLYKGSWNNSRLLIPRKRELTFRVPPLFVILLILKISPFYRETEKGMT